MKKMIALFASLVFLCSTFTLAVCEETGVSPRIASILNAWNAKDGKELRLRILDYWNEHSDGTHFSWPLNIRLGGTTVDLINEPESWDLAIVSSKDVDLQELADAGLIKAAGFFPADEVALFQWLLPHYLKDIFPVDPILMYSVYCYDYDAQTDDATLLICQADIGSKKNSPRVPDVFSTPILNRRTAAQIRSVEGIVRVRCSVNGRKLFSPSDGRDWTLQDLIRNPSEWDVAEIAISDISELASLDEAGLLYDFSSDPYLSSRNTTNMPIPTSLYSEDGRLIAIPFAIWDEGNWVMVVNPMAVDIPLALDYIAYYIKSQEWGYDFILGVKTREKDVPEEIRKYGICMYKDEIDW